MGYDPARVFVVRNTYSPAFAHALASSTKAPPEDVLRVAVPSAYYIHKNLEFVPEVAAALKDRGLENVRFALTLPEQDQPWQRIRARAEQLQVANMVKTEGRVPHGQIADLYRSAHAVFLPTLLECSTATYPEAFAAGAPLVTSDRDFARELCGDGALFVDPFNAEQAAEALARALTDQDVREELVSHGRAALEENYISPEEKWRQQLLCMETLARGEPIPQELT
jgi:glycosyltransferase involved in cell wall biosynthesis